MTTTDRVFFRYRWALIATASLLLSGISFIGLVVYQQTTTLQSAVETTEQIIDGNVRVYSQVQRELLRLAAVVGEGETDPEILGFHEQLVGQRAQEGTLSYQVSTLGQPLLLEEARTLADRWNAADALLMALIDGGNTDRVLRATLLEEIRQLELGYNRLVSDSEINRRNIAGAANDAAATLLGRSRSLLQGGIATMAAFVVFTLVLAFVYDRIDRQRTATAHQLEALNASLRTLSEVAARTNNAVVITDAEGVTTWVNEAFTTLTGYTAEEAVGRRPGCLLQGRDTDHDVVAFMSDRLRNARGFTSEVLNYSKDGEPYWIRVEVQPVVDDAGRLCNFIAVETDITAQRDLESKLRTAKQVAEDIAAAKANFLASMSHEIRTPLNAVLGLNSLLLETGLDRQQEEYVRTASTSGQLLLEIINDILNYSALESGAVELERRSFDPRVLVAETVGVLEHDAVARGLRLRADVADGVPATLLGDPMRLKQILVNLIGNSVKFTDAGEVTVRVEARDSDDPAVAALRVSVVDTGIGIPQDRLDRLFQPFSQIDASTTRRYGGSGLGLAICKDLVELMGGAITVEPTPGAGTTMVVDLALPVGTVIQARPAEASVELPAAGLRILLAEDDPVNQMVATHMLAHLGVDPVVVSNGQQALDVMEAQDFDLVLMDVHMPEMDGPTAVHHIRERWPAERQPMIVGFTATALEGDRERLLAGGMDGYLAKPVQLHGLAEVLRSVPRRLTVGPAMTGQVTAGPAS